MNDLISRSALYNGIKLHYQPTDQKYPSDRYWAIGYNAGLERGLYSIVHAHAVDAVPVVHGRWYLLDECSNEGVYCSVCQKKVYRKDYANQKVKSNYCPNCGADMRERKEK